MGAPRGNSLPLRHRRHIPTITILCSRVLRAPHQPAKASCSPILEIGEHCCRHVKAFSKSLLVRSVFCSAAGGRRDKNPGKAGGGGGVDGWVGGLVGDKRTCWPVHKALLMQNLLGTKVL